LALWVTVVKTSHQITLPNQSTSGFEIGELVTIIHLTKGENSPVFYVQEELTDLDAMEATARLPSRPPQRQSSDSGFRTRNVCWPCPKAMFSRSLL